MTVSEDKNRQIRQSTQAVRTGYGFTTGPLHWIDVSEHVIEVIDVPQVTPVAGSAKWFAGLANYRGDLLPVTDLSNWLGVDSTRATGIGKTSSSTSDARFLKTTSTRRLLVLENSSSTSSSSSATSAGVEKVGLLVDEVAGYSNEAQFGSGEHKHSSKADCQSSSSDSKDCVSADFVNLMSPLDACEQARVHEILEYLWSGSASLKLVCDLSRLFKSPAFSDIRPVIAKADLEAIA